LLSNATEKSGIHQNNYRMISNAKPFSNVSDGFSFAFGAVGLDRVRACHRSGELRKVMPLFVGTMATAARVVRDGDFAQLRLAEPVVAAPRR